MVTTQDICWSHWPRSFFLAERDTEVYRDVLRSFVKTFGCNVESHLKGFQKYWNANLYGPKTKYFAIQCNQLPKVSLCFWEEQSVDEEQYGTLVEWNWEEKPDPVPLWPPHIWYGLRCDRTGTLTVRGLRLTAWAVKTRITYKDPVRTAQ